MKISRMAMLGVVVVISVIAALQAYSYEAPQQYAWGQMTTGIGNGCGQMNGLGIMMGQEMIGNMNGGMMNQYHRMNDWNQQQYMNGNHMPTQQCQAMHQ